MGELVTRETACCDTDPAMHLGKLELERKNTSNSDNDVTATLSTASSSQGSIQVLAESDAEATQGANSGRRSPRSPRRKSSLGKTDSMMRGSLGAQDFFGAERVFQEPNSSDDIIKLPAVDRNQEGHSHIELKKLEDIGIVAPDTLLPSEDTVKSQPSNLTPSHGQLIQEAIDPAIVSPNTSSAIPEGQVLKCQCIIL